MNKEELCKDLDFDYCKNMETNISEQMREKNEMLTKHKGDEYDQGILSSMREQQKTLHKRQDSNTKKVNLEDPDKTIAPDDQKKQPNIVNETPNNHQNNASATNIAKNKSTKKPKFQIVILVRNLKLGLFTAMLLNSAYLTGLLIDETDKYNFVYPIILTLSELYYLISHNNISKAKKKFDLPVRI